MIHYLGEWFSTHYQEHEFYGFDDETGEICYILPSPGPRFHCYIRNHISYVENMSHDCSAKRAYDLLLKAISEGRIVKKKSVEELENESLLI